MEATYDYIERTGSLEPSLRDILRALRPVDPGLLPVLPVQGRAHAGAARRRPPAAGRLSGPADGPGRPRRPRSGPGSRGCWPRPPTRRPPRTRPFAANEDRLAELFPEEQRESVDLLVGCWSTPRPGHGAGVGPGGIRDDAEAIYRLVFGDLRGHLILRTRPSASEVEHLVRFCLEREPGLSRGGRP